MNQRRPETQPSGLVERIKLAIVTFGFLGLAPFAPGTFGTLGGVALAYALRGTDLYLLWVLLLAAVFYAVGRQLGDFAERRAGSKDPGFYVLDEVIGYLIAVAWTEGPSLLTLTVAFLLFRFFDIAKIPPMRRFERIGGGDGILLDDVIAGLYALAVLTVLRLLLLEPARWVV